MVTKAMTVEECDRIIAETRKAKRIAAKQAKIDDANDHAAYERACHNGFVAIQHLYSESRGDLWICQTTQTPQTDANGWMTYGVYDRDARVALVRLDKAATIPATICSVSGETLAVFVHDESEGRITCVPIGVSGGRACFGRFPDAIQSRFIDRFAHESTADRA